MASSKINIDFSFAIKEESLNNYHDQIEELKAKIATNNIIGYQFLGCFNIFKNIQKNDYIDIKKIPQWLINEHIEYLVVIAPQHVCLQAEALIKFAGRDSSSDSKIKVIFVNECISARDIAKLTSFLSDKHFAINIISQKGETLETLLIFRELKAMLYKILGSVNAKKYIFATTNNNYGKLFKETKVNEYRHFVLLDNTTEKFLGYSAAIMLPLACVGVNLDKYLNGANAANEYFSKMPLKKNPAYQYAVIRRILLKNNYNFENINAYSNSDLDLARLFKMYLSETGLKNKNGIYVNSSLQGCDNNTFSENHTSSPFNPFDTSLVVENQQYDYEVSILSEHDNDNLNYLSKLTYNSIGKTITKSMRENHVIIYKIPHILIKISDNFNDDTLGWIMAFIHRASIMFAYLRELNPFQNSGLDSYNINLIKNITELSGGSKND
ncbi:glucose-6-phosphate isomerase [Mycoplasma phocoeninasale]|uniref:Glucose-6-phosphate isomerase n=1 Tax=Mycoplasma phocoeninasale TaxID=2726117 RepID=A0A858U4H9_9MOLU|nr:glucose-6-phosphate isomerase [Mycoplasma phocoeninasale]MBN0970585.1 glucose-6-phosphate isomerase [Mycoplasma phocoeninasale]QJG66297.1 glucose-6-phosphate isomerase [Mycoplasma phocoeninasale]